MDLFAGQLWRRRHREETGGHNRGRREWDELRTQRANIHVTICKRDSKWEFAGWPRELDPVLPDNQEWGMGGGFRRQGTFVYLWLIHVVVWQRPAQYCRAVVLLKKKKKLTHLKKTAVHRHKWAGGGNCLNGYYRGNWLKWNITCIIVLCQFRSFLNLGCGGGLLWEREAAGNRGRKTRKWLPALCSLCGGQFKGLSRPHL